MSTNTTLGGFLIDCNGARQQLPTIPNPSNLDIENVIKNVCDAGRGVVTLGCNPSPQTGPEKLDLYVEAGNLLLMLGTYEEDGDYNVKTFANANMPNELITVLGEKFPARAVIHDVSIVCKAFNEFALSGDVSL